MVVYNTIVKPILTYGCQSWVVNKKKKSTIQAVVMTYLRAIKGMTLRDKIRNEAIKEDLNMESILESSERKQLSNKRQKKSLDSRK